MHTPAPPQPVEALLLVGSHCPHCQAVLDGLARLVKAGRIARLTVINLNLSPEAPEARGIRSVPWTRIGPFELSGALSASELADWAEIAAAGDGWGRYFAHLIESQRLSEVIERVQFAPATLIDLLNLFAAPDTPMSVRIGISAVMESLSGTDILRRAVPAIETLALSDSPQVRADACYFLGLCGEPAALPTVLRLREDEDADVREVAADVLALLRPCGCHGSMWTSPWSRAPASRSRRGRRAISSRSCVWARVRHCSASTATAGTTPPG